MSMYVPVFEQIVIMPIVNVTPCTVEGLGSRSVEVLEDVRRGEARIRRQPLGDHMAEIDKPRVAGCRMSLVGRVSRRAMPRV